MSSAGGAVKSIDKAATNKMLLKGTKSNRYNSKGRNKNSRRNRGEMKLLGKYLDELRRNKSFDDLQTESEFEKVFAEGGVKIGKYFPKSLCYAAIYISLVFRLQTNTNLSFQLPKYDEKMVQRYHL